MDKIQRIEELLTKWVKFKEGSYGNVSYYTGGETALTKALSILKEPSNTQMHADGLYQCPYEKATRCRMDETCRGCEVWAAHQ